MQLNSDVFSCSVGTNQLIFILYYFHTLHNVKGGALLASCSYTHFVVITILGLIVCSSPR